MSVSELIIKYYKKVCASKKEKMLMKFSFNGNELSPDDEGTLIKDVGMRDYSTILITLDEPMTTAPYQIPKQSETDPKHEVSQQYVQLQKEYHQYEQPESKGSVLLNDVLKEEEDYNKYYKKHKTENFKNTDNKKFYNINNNDKFEINNSSIYNQKYISKKNYGYQAKINIGYKKPIFAINDNDNNDNVVNNLMYQLNEERQKIIRLEKELSLAKQKIKQLEDKDEKTLAINFISYDEKINYTMKCMSNDMFSNIERIIYSEFPECKTKNLIFMKNGNVININETLEKNGIKNGDSIILKYQIN